MFVRKPKQMPGERPGPIGSTPKCQEKGEPFPLFRPPRDRRFWRSLAIGEHPARADGRGLTYGYQEDTLQVKTILMLVAIVPVHDRHGGRRLHEDRGGCTRGEPANFAIESGQPDKT